MTIDSEAAIVVLKMNCSVRTLAPGLLRKLRWRLQRKFDRENFIALLLYEAIAHGGRTPFTRPGRARTD